MTPRRRFTTVSHEARDQLGLTIAEYCVADLVHRLASNPGSNNPGWCWATKDSLAEMLGIGPASIYRALEKLENLKLIERQEKTKFLRATPLWYNTVELYNTRDYQNDSEAIKGSPRLSDQEPETIKVRNTTYNKDKDIDKGTNVPKAKDPKREQRTKDAEEAVRHFEGTFGIVLTPAGTQLNYARHLLAKAEKQVEDKRPLQTVIGWIKAAYAVSDQQFAPNISDMKSLYYKIDALAIYYKKNQPRKVVSV